MRVLANHNNYDKAISLAKDIKGLYKKPVIFHCYWNGKNLNEKHFYSILSCYYFNVLNKNHKIILWLENNIPNNFNIEISKYCEIRQFSIDNERKGTCLEDKEIIYHPDARIKTEESNCYRMLLLYKYGGCWFDLDCLFLRSFDPIFVNYENEICLYQWESQPYPNNAIFISLTPKSSKMKSCIEYINNLKKGWGFQRSNLKYNIKELDMLVLPCSWFDAGWVKTETIEKESFKKFFKATDKQYNFENFFTGAFCYHWHNKWNSKIEDTSIMSQLINIIKRKLKLIKKNT